MSKKLGVIYSPYQLDEQEIKTVVAHFPVLREREIKNVVLEDLLAGVVIRYDTKLIDLSLSQGLQNLKYHVYENY
ncbi:F0F1 ATP synthase subunit delta [Candidatus Roizmanbacteria bacterium]|nr:F0F1 ATP synthase subunit delta [Candidatus Roizmanbacteria bacterium]